MPETVNVHEAKTHLSKLLARVEAGEEIVIARGGKPIARLVPEGGEKRERPLGSAKGRIAIHESFYEPLPEDMLDAMSPPPESAA